MKRVNYCDNLCLSIITNSRYLLEKSEEILKS